MTIETLTGKTRIAGIFGWPVDHSRSPRLHGYWLQQFKIDGAYIPFAAHPNKLEQGIRALPALGAPLHAKLAEFYTREVAAHIRGAY